MPTSHLDVYTEIYDEDRLISDLYNKLIQIFNWKLPIHLFQHSSSTYIWGLYILICTIFNYLKFLNRGLLLTNKVLTQCFGQFDFCIHYGHFTIAIMDCWIAALYLSLRWLKVYRNILSSLLHTFANFIRFWSTRRVLQVEKDFFPCLLTLIIACLYILFLYMCLFFNID